MGKLTEAWNEEDARRRETEAPRPRPSLGSGYAHFTCACDYCMERADCDVIHSALGRHDLDGPRSSGWVPEAHPYNPSNVTWCASRDEIARDQRATLIYQDLQTRYRAIAGKRPRIWPSVTWSIVDGQISEVVGALGGSTVTIDGSSSDASIREGVRAALMGTTVHWTGTPWRATIA
jgi:hypothetical protein